MTRTLQARWFIALVGLVVLCFSFPAFSRTIRVGVYHNPPMVFQDEKGRITGFYPRILEYIAQKEGWTIEYRWDIFTNHLKHLQNGEVDLLSCIAHSPERAQNFDFNEETIWLNWGTVYTHPSISVQSFLDLNVKKIFVVADSIYYQHLQHIVTGFGLDCQFIEVEDSQEVLKKTEEEKGVGVVSRTFGLLFGARYNLRPSPLVFSPVSLRFASPKGKNREILETLDLWLSKLKEDPRSIYHQAIHEFLEIQTPWQIPRWVYTVLLFVSGTVVTLVTFTLLLRHQVARKTREVMEKNMALQKEIAHRREAEAKLALQLQVEHLLAQISTHLFSGEPLDVAAHLALETVGNFLQAEYLLVQLPQGCYPFIHPKTEKSEMEPLLPEILKIPSVRETWAKEGEILFSDWENLILERKKSVLFALAFHFPEGEGFLEGMLSGENDIQEEQIHHIPLITRYLRALFEYIWAVKQRQERDRWFMVTLRSLGDAVITTDAEGGVTFLNPVAEKLTGWPHQEAQEKPVEEIFRIVDEKTGEPVESPVQRVLRSGKVTGLANHTLLIRRDGEKIAIDDSGAPILDEGGVIRGVVLVFRDVTERRRLEAQIRESERNYRLLFNSMLDGFALLERVVCNGETVDYRVLEANPSLKRLLPHFDRVEGKLVSELFPNWKERFRLPLPSGLSVDPPQKHEVALPELDAFWEITSFTISPERIGIIIADITARKRAEEKIRYFTFHDSLTGLYNRLFAEEELKRLDDGRHLPLSILFADLNGLKFVNDTFGHHRGDLVLQEATQILRNSCRESDIVSRFGGDEFLIILPSTPSSTLAEIAERINARSLEVQREDPFFLGLSVGLATKNDPSQDLWAIIQEAEEHSYERKLKERTVYQGESTLALFEKALFHLRIEEPDELKTLEEFSKLVGEKLGLSESELHKTRLLARFHDVGKFTIPAEILLKTTPLPPEERAILRSYPSAGYRIARTNPLLLPIAEEIYAFREHWDGNGYPLGKKGEQIPFITRLVQIVEAYFALRSPRPYRQAFAPDEAVAILKQEKGRRFDPDIVSLFLEVLAQGSGFPSLHPQE